MLMPIAAIEVRHYVSKLAASARPEAPVRAAKVKRTAPMRAGEIE